jgi:hypothetical protein
VCKWVVSRGLGLGFSRMGQLAALVDRVCGLLGPFDPARYRAAWRGVEALQRNVWCRCAARGGGEAEAGSGVETAPRSGDGWRVTDDGVRARWDVGACGRRG